MRKIVRDLDRLLRGRFAERGSDPASIPLAHLVQGALVLNGVMFAAAAIAGQTLLQRHYRALIARNPRHRIARASWLVLYCFVAIQLAWVLRPFVGSPGLPPTFFREDAWSNAYVMLWKLVARFVTGG